jgi:hypothetical protein
MLIALLSFLALSQVSPDNVAWRTTTGASGYELALGEAGADHVDILFRCARRGARVVRLNVDGIYTGDGPEPRQLLIESGRARARVSLLYDDGSRPGGVFAAIVPLASPALAAFARTGRLMLSAGNGEIEGHARSASDRAAIGSFFALCRGR